MAYVVVVTDPDTALGFRLAGIQTLAVQQTQEAPGLLRELLERGEASVVMVDEGYLPLLPERLRRRIEESLKPVFVPIPQIQAWREGERREDYLARLLRRVIGYQIRIQR